MKEWTNEMADSQDIVDPIIGAIRFAYKLTRQNKDKTIPYYGYDRTAMLHVVPSIPKALTPEMLEYDEDRQRDALTVLVWMAFQLGTMQGQRIQIENQRIPLLVLKLTLQEAGIPDWKIKSYLEPFTRPGR